MLPKKGRETFVEEPPVACFQVEREKELRESGNQGEDQTGVFMCMLDARFPMRFFARFVSDFIHFRCLLWVSCV